AYIEGAFADSVISSAEAKAIAEHIRRLNDEKADVDQAYTTVHDHADLSGTPKTDLAPAQWSYDPAHTNSTAAIDTAIADSEITQEDRGDVDAKAGAYRSALATLRQRLNEAKDAIKNAAVSTAVSQVTALITPLNAIIISASEPSTRPGGAPLK